MTIATDPPVSEAQRRAMFAAREGRSRLGIPRRVGAEFAAADPGGRLPEKAKDMAPSKWAVLKRLFNEWINEESREAEHQGNDANPDPNADGRHDRQGDGRGFAAGVAFITPAGKVLLLRRSEDGDHAGEWAFPGGMRDDLGEEPWRTAQREAREEVGDDCVLDCVVDGAHPIDESDEDAGLIYATYAQPVDDEFEPTLNDEHTEHRWAGLDDLPEPIHPGVRATIERLTGAPDDDDDAEDVEFERGPGGVRQPVAHLTPELLRSERLADVDEGARARRQARTPIANVQRREPSQGRDESEETKKRHEGKLSETTREAIGRPGSEHREDEPADAFLLGAARKYPVKVKRDGEYKYDRGLLLAAARRARMQGRGDLARKADTIRAREFGEKPEGEDEVPAASTAPNAAVPMISFSHRRRGAARDDFAAVERHAAHESGVRDPAAVAAAVGFKKYGKAGMERKAHAGRDARPRFDIGTRLRRLKERRTGVPAQDARIEPRLVRWLAFDWSPDPMLRANRLVELAYDRETVRSKDKDGRLHISDSPISKSNVCPYMGKEIPGWQELGLEPEKRYMLYRDPKELEASAASFAGLPILSEHVPIDAKTHDPRLVVGAITGTPKFDGTYLRAPLAFWPQDAIDGIESSEKKQLSAAYHYIPVMEKGVTPGGVHYDGRMTQIVGNHLAQVKVGRAGDDVIVGDAAIRCDNYSFRVFMN